MTSGYKEIFSSYSYGGFGTSASCEINVLCPLGDNWQNERYSVALLLGDNSEFSCSGVLVNNTCNINLPYLLTANHCYTDDGTANQDVSGWTFIFQYWSPTCSPTQDNTNTLLFNGSVLEANYAPSDFCLVKLNQIPATNSNITYAGWNNSAISATSTVAIHQPKTDVMKIASDKNAPIAITWPGVSGLTHWRAHFQQGTVEPGSSGSPLFDQNHRIVGQLHGDQNNKGNYCKQQIGEYGRFDVSWTGGGTNSTRLSNWLDPSNSGATTTNTTNVSQLLSLTDQSQNQNILSISGPSLVCQDATYSLAPSGFFTSWSLSPTNWGTISSSGNPAYLTSTSNGQATLTAIYTCPNTTLSPITVTKIIEQSAPTIGGSSAIDGSWYRNSFNDINYELAANVNNPVCTNYTINTTMYITGAKNVKWSMLSPPSGTINYKQVGDNLDLTLYNSSQKAVFKLDATNACGTTTNEYAWVASNCSGSPCFQYALAPNPTANNLNVTTNDAAPCRVGAAVLPPDSLLIAELNIYDKNGVLRTQAAVGGNPQGSINVGALSTDTYILEIKSTKGYKERQLFIKQ